MVVLSTGKCPHRPPCLSWHHALLPQPHCAFTYFFSPPFLPTLPLQEWPFPNISKSLASCFDLEILSVPESLLQAMSNNFFLLPVPAAGWEKREGLYPEVKMGSEGHGLERLVFYFFSFLSVLWPSYLKCRHLASDG